MESSDDPYKTKPPQKGGIQRFFQRCFHIQASEFRLVQLLFIYLTSIGTFYAIACTMSESLFLSKLGAEQVESVLPWVYIGSAVATIIVAWVYCKIELRFTRIQLIIGTQIFFTLSLLVIRELIRTDEIWTYYLLMLWVEACADFSIILFFSFVSDFFNDKQANRLYGFLAGGLAVGALIGGNCVSLLTSFIGLENLLYACAALLLCGALLARYIHQQHQSIRNSDDDEEEQQAGSVSFLSLFKHGYVRAIMIVVFAGVIVSIFVDYQMMVTVSKTLDQTEMVGFFENFYGIGGAAKILIQFVIVGWLLRRFGSKNCLFILPILMVAGGIAFFLSPELVCAAAANLIFLCLSETLDLPARELLFVPLPKKLRYRSQAFVNGIFGAISDISGGVALLVLAGLFAELSIFTAVLASFAVLWVIAIAFLKKHKLTTATDSNEEKDENDNTSQATTSLSRISSRECIRSINIINPDTWDPEAVNDKRQWQHRKAA